MAVSPTIPKITTTERATPVQISMEPAAATKTSVKQVYCIAEANENVEYVVVMSPLDYLRWSSSRDDSESNNQTVKEIVSQISSNKNLSIVKSEGQFDLQGHSVEDINTSGSVASRHDNESSVIVNKEDKASHLTAENTIVQPNMAPTGEKSVQTLASDLSNNQNDDLFTHKRKKHNKEKKFKCKVCLFASPYKRAIDKHMMTHTGEKPYKCDVCEYAGTSSDNLIRHKRTHSETKFYHCGLCDFSCNQKPDLGRHMRKHTGEKPFKCCICGYEFTRRDTLSQHMRRHTGETPYMCDVCDFKCYRNDVLSTHKMVHSGDRHYKCDFCEFSNQLKSQLITHMRIHKEDERYRCDFCDYSCEQNSDLVKHLKVHTGDKQHVCDICYYACKQKGNLDSHIIRKHTIAGEKL